MRIESGMRAILTMMLIMTSPAEAYSSPLLGKWKLTELVNQGPAKKLELVQKESAERIAKPGLSVIEFAQEKILVDGKELCVGKSEIYQEKDGLRYDKTLVEKSEFYRARMDPKYDLGAILQVCKRKGRRVNGLEFFGLSEWVARCSTREKDGVRITSDLYYSFDENTLLAQGDTNACFRRLRSPDDKGKYFVLEALRSYSPNKSEPASEDFLNPVKVQIPKTIAVTRGNPGNFVAKLEFKNGLGVVTSCSYKGNVTKKNSKPSQLAYELQACGLDKKALDTLSVVSVKLRIVNSDKSAGVTAAETTFDYEP